MVAVMQQIRLEDESDREHDICRECGTRIISDKGVSVCPRCGLVHDERVLVEDMAISEDGWCAGFDPGAGKTRVYTAILKHPDWFVHPPFTIMKIGKFYRDARGQMLPSKLQHQFTRMHKIARLRNDWAVILSRIFAEMTRQLGIEGIRARALYIFKKARQDPRLNRTNSVIILATSIYLASKETPRHASIQEIANQFCHAGHKVSTHQVLVTMERVMKIVEVHPRLKSNDEYVSRIHAAIAKHLPADQVSTYTRELRDVMHQLARCAGKINAMKPGLPVAAVTYAAGQVLGIPLSQLEIAEACEVTDVALRYTYKRFFKQHVSILIKSRS